MKRQRKGDEFTWDYYWEHLSEDPFHKHYIQVDLQGIYEIEEIDLFFAEEAGFSSHFNWREFHIYGSLHDPNTFETIAAIENPEGIPCRSVPLTPGNRFRYLKIEIQTPTGLENNSTARLAELIVRGRTR